MTHYIVVSPEMSKMVPITDDGLGPIEDFCCVVSVDADSKTEARKIAIKSPEMRDWVDDARSDDKNPFAGLKVYLGKCKHGVCWCDLCRGECEECYAEYDAEHPEETTP